MRELLAGVSLQLRLFRRGPGQLLIFATIPFFSAIFLSGFEHAPPSHLLPYALLAPVMMGLWLVAIDLADTVINFERAHGILELLVAAPADILRTMLGRVLTVTLLGMGTLLEVLAVARFAFHQAVVVYHPVTMAIALLATSIATAGTATAMVAIFLAIRAAQRFANSLSYPFYILGGVLAPISLLPFWLRPISQVIYLHWSSDLLRATLGRPPIPNVPLSIGVILLLGCAGYAIGSLLLRRVIAKLRTDGTIGLT
jgi:ABC-2 type transport system permease protein